MMRSRRSWLLMCAGAASAQKEEVREASGAARLGGHLLIADDSTVGRYFRLQLPRKPAGLMLLNDLDPQAVRLKQATLAIDLESIGVLADGRIVALSERLRSLVDDGGIVAEYDSLFSEVGKRGLEGLAIRPLAKRASRIAVLWEGGYPDTGSLPARLRTSRAPQPLLPLVLVHDLAAHGRAGRLKLANAVSTVELDVPHLPGDEPAAQRFRAPDLVWTRLGEDWGFIVLITSQSAGPNPSYDHHWLQRFTSEGKRFGEPLDLAKLAPAAHAGANWEGLCWLEAGRTLIVVHEAQAKLPAAALVVELPAEWQCRGEGL